MSTQRRASQTIAAIEVDRAGVWHGITAPLMSIIWLAWAWLMYGDQESRTMSTDWEATNSLLSDYRNETLASQESLAVSPPGATAATAPPLGHPAPASRWRARGLSGPSNLRVTHRSSLRHVPILPVRAHLHTTLPIAPAGEVRWAERHDGKRDLYFQHAA